MTTSARAMPNFCRSMVCASCVWLAGCAAPGSPSPFGAGSDAAPFSNPALSIQNARDTVTVGKSSKAEVLAALGPATVINFDSGFQVWVYRAKSRQPAETKAELVILFTPDGIAKKIRLRPAYTARS